MSPPKRILVVEDDVGSRTGLAALLRDEGYEVNEAENGKVAWSMVLQLAPDLVLTDLTMPLVGGRELITMLRAAYPRIPIAVVSVEDPLDAGRRSVSLQADHFFHKPVDIDAVLRFVEASLVNPPLEPGKSAAPPLPPMP